MRDVWKGMMLIVVVLSIASARGNTMTEILIAYVLYCLILAVVVGEIFVRLTKK